MNALHVVLLDWAVRCFGADHVHQRRVRALRIVEEAVELAQACEVDAELVCSLVRNVYSRPKGDVYQELGGVVVTAAVFSAAQFVQDSDLVMLAETRRILAKPVEHFTKRNQDKIDLGFK